MQKYIGNFVHIAIIIMLYECNVKSVFYRICVSSHNVEIPSLKVILILVLLYDWNEEIKKIDDEHVKVMKISIKAK